MESKLSNDPSGSIFIDMDANKRRVVKLLSDKWKIEQELENIQSECRHENKVLRQIQVGNGSELRWVCDDCNRPLGWPSQEDLKNYMKKS